MKVIALCLAWPASINYRGHVPGPGVESCRGRLKKGTANWRKKSMTTSSTAQISWFISPPCSKESVGPLINVSTIYSRWGRDMGPRSVKIDNQDGYGGWPQVQLCLANLCFSLTFNLCSNIKKSIWKLKKINLKINLKITVLVATISISLETPPGQFVMSWHGTIHVVTWCVIFFCTFIATQGCRSHDWRERCRPLIIVNVNVITCHLRFKTEGEIKITVI